jgi:hypothetical protein
MKKICLVILVFGLLSCATTGVQICDKNQVGSFRCHSITLEVEQCKNEKGDYLFETIEPECLVVDECNDFCEAPICESLLQVECAKDGSVYSCKEFKSCAMSVDEGGTFDTQ